MANKKPASTKKRAPSAAAGSSSSKVTRITASDSKPASTVKKAAPKVTAKAAETTVEAKSKKPKKAKSDRKNVFARMGGYFTGAWYELRQVHWPDRKNSWALTVGLIVFTLLFVAIILLLDALFQYLFSLVLGK